MKIKLRLQKYTVHEALEGLWCGFQTKGMKRNLKEAKRSDNSCLWNVFFVQRNMMQATYEVYFREDSFSFKDGGKVLHVGDRVAVVGSFAIQASEIPAVSPAMSIRLDNNVQG